MKKNIEEEKNLTMKTNTLILGSNAFLLLNRNSGLTMSFFRKGFLYLGIAFILFLIWLVLKPERQGI
ncbi:hypothetical protein AKJ38_00625 [candidate division MSBL1 archaeon SCGC-AAA259I14]|uniref:Uncharacterized protein n=1 Tax=candidate division MSBL1 archaeon SCGC-AAA259I14 TaxID=1698268 RepID=A0A133UU48_9EURY|nr:hypothetical protein AKJ38_00625 [candidate division MSBL1 archaeon SCGC-AAA259I14]